MFRGLKVTALIPSFNEEKLIRKTIDSLPPCIDEVIAVNDGSTDGTLAALRDIASHDPRIRIIDNKTNMGLGASMRKAFRAFLESDGELACVLPGDAQHDGTTIPGMLETLLDNNLDYVKPNRFLEFESLRQMPRYRRLGNMIITILTKFATGYYSIFDSQNGGGVFPRATLARLPVHLIGDRYDYENTLLIALAVIGAKVRDFPAPAIYGDEDSTIKLIPTAIRALYITFTGFWRRIWYSYVYYNFHPIALFLFSGVALFVVGFGFCMFIVVERLAYGNSPSTGTVMLGVLPLILSFQLVLTAILMDVNNEVRS